ncbi:MAG: PhnD/SsuA/transferrin family substrate-binding protein [Deltaproteobacteria bacterium]|nr:PhnD/SsuA/transferrin family substrate-binding protein [Deltaproteobacteria bacterium]
MIRLLYLVLFLVLLRPVPCSASEPVDFYFYFPDSSQVNLSHLKREMDRFLSQAGLSARFQPFAHKIDFDNTLKSSRPALVFLPEWYYRCHGRELGLIPLLTPLRQGRPDYTKLLLVRKNAPWRLADFSGRTVAMTTMGSDSGETMNRPLFNGKKVDLLKNHIVNISKDADAFFAVALGHVDAALVGRDTLSTVGKLDTKLVEMLEPLIESNPIPMPLLCMVAGRLDPANIELVKKIFMAQNGGSPSPAIMEMLHIDGWQTLSN